MSRKLSVLGAALATLFLVSGCTTSGNPNSSSDGASVDSPDAGVSGGNPDASSIPEDRCEQIGGGEPDPSLPADRCEVNEGSGDALLYRGVVLSPEGPIYGGELVTKDELIVCVGDCAAAYADATVIDCGAAVISPGLINPHDHMSFNENGPFDPSILADTRYDHRHEWGGSVSTPQNPSGIGRHQAGSLWTELRHLLGGTTTVVGSGNASDVIRHLDDLRNRDRDHGFLEVVYETFPLRDRAWRGEDELIPPNDCGWDFRFDEREAAGFAAYIPHTAEGIDYYANEEFRCQSNSLDEGARNFTQPNTSHIHAIGLTAVDYHRMARQGSRLVWSPRSNIALYGMTADVSTFHRFGGTIAISTDWAYTGSATMFRELACADSYNRDYLDNTFCDRELWEMATINAAIATGNDHNIGSLEVGKIADILIVNGEAGSYRSILEAESKDVLLVAFAGEVMFADREVLTGLGDPCDPIDVCGEARGVCLSRKLNEVRPDRAVSYDELVENMRSTAYPVFFCDEPPDEPTCVPSRPGEYTGLPNADDSSGDGVPDSDDLCPSMFHPIRPMDNGRQADFDGDGVGDPCDESPVPDDISGDGHANDDDNCPYHHNPDQTDTSGDGLGDACHPCPERFAPDGICPLPSDSIRDIHTSIDEGQDVFVSGAVVTGVYAQGLTIQDPNPEDGNPELSGILVFSFDPPGVSIGDVVDVEGRKDVFGGNVEIGAASVRRVGNATPLAPTEVTVQQAASGDYLGVLVRLTNGTVTEETYDCSQDHGNCSDSGLWEVSAGGSAVLIFDRLYGDQNWDDRIGTLPVSGVIMNRFNRTRVMPRSSADF